jgi:hypothetical protein
MTSPRISHLAIATALAVCSTSAALAQTGRFEELGNLPFAADYPTAETAQRLKDELLFERGVQSYLWALPAINM